MQKKSIVDLPQGNSYIFVGWGWVGEGKFTIYPFFQWDVISQNSCDIMRSQNRSCDITHVLS